MSKDSIDRQAAIEAICEHGTELERRGITVLSVANHKQVTVDLLESLPSAQPEIIRCKDCKWYGRADKRRFYRGTDCLQKRIDTIVPDRDFCSKAERRTDD